MENGASKKRRRQTCRYDLAAFQRAMLEKGLDTQRTAALVQARFGEAAPRRREVYYLLAGERSFPNPEYVSMIAEVLDVSLQSIVRVA